MKKPYKKNAAQIILVEEGKKTTLGSSQPTKRKIDLTGVKLIVPPGCYKLGVKEKSSRLKKKTSVLNGQAPCHPGKHRGRPMKWTLEKRRKILRKIDSGKETAVEVCRKLGINPTLVSRWRKASEKKN